MARNEGLLQTLLKSLSNCLMEGLDREPCERSILNVEKISASGGYPVLVAVVSSGAAIYQAFGHSQGPRLSASLFLPCSRSKQHLRLSHSGCIGDVRFSLVLVWTHTITGSSERVRGVDKNPTMSVLHIWREHVQGLGTRERQLTSGWC